MKRRETGVLGEKLAQDFLTRKGFSILETNYRCSHGEIDIIANEKDCLVFVEVRTKTGHDFGSPEESITAVKKERLRTVAEHYLQNHEPLPASWRIDMVAVELGKGNVPLRIELIENAVGGE
jgi:putative endonuclease